MHSTLFTRSHESLTIEAFITRLQAAQVKTVVDVCELPPVAQKRVFKISLLCCLSAHDIAYLHAPRAVLTQAHSQPITVTHLTAKTALPDLDF